MCLFANLLVCSCVLFVFVIVCLRVCLFVFVSFLSSVCAWSAGLFDCRAVCVCLFLRVCLFVGVCVCDSTCVCLCVGGLMS